MNQERLNEVINNAMSRIKASLKAKNDEYVRSGDRLGNFKRSGRILGQTPEQVLLEHFTKHYESMMSIVEDVEKGILPSLSMLDEKIKDLVNYPILFEALILERIEQSGLKSDCSKKGQHETSL